MSEIEAQITPSKGKIWKAVLLTLAVIACLLFFLFSKAASKGGFTADRISSNLPYNSEWEIETPSNSELIELRAIFSQPFTYLGNGRQCYAFVSQDQKIVLKFFRMRHFLPKNWLRHLPIPGLERFKMRKIEKRHERLKATFGSYKMAHQQLKEETGLVFIHLNKSNYLKTKLTLIDKFGRKHHVDLDQTHFILQRRADLIRDRLHTLMQSSDRDGARLAIRGLLEHVISHCQKGFIDKDSSISHNYGFVADRVIHFDVGHLLQDEEVKEPALFQREVLRVGKKLEDWIMAYYPELCEELEEEIDRLITN